MQKIESKEIAEKVGQMIRSRSDEGDIAMILASLDKINHRLEKLESGKDAVSSIRILRSEHPSQERFEIAEAIADVIYGGISKEKACTFEPDGKPCDHCSMCSSRGF